MRQTWIAVVMATFSSLATAQTSDEPLVTRRWTPEAPPPDRAHAPQLIPFEGSHALELSSARSTQLSLADLPADGLQLPGPFSLGVTFALSATPSGNRGIVSRWITQPGQRSFELGIDSERRLYGSVSASGNFDEQAVEVTAEWAVKLHALTSAMLVFDPGQSLTLFLNGQPAGQVTDRVPAGLHACATPAILGARSSGDLHVDALLRELWVDDRPLAPAEVARWSSERGLSEPLRSAATRPLSWVLDHPEAPPAPARQITHGPGFHWFGYYDKFQFDPTDRYVLSMQVGFEHRSPRPDDVVRVGMIDLEDDDRWIPLGETQAWCWQQGCMLQWRPESASEVLWNDRQGDRFVCHILDVETRQRRTLPRPVYHVGPDGRFGLSADFARIQDMRPGYGYVGLPDAHRDDLAPGDSGIWRVDLSTGSSELIVSIAHVAAIAYPDADRSVDKHYFNHLQWSPDGARFFFLHRWRSPRFRGFRTRALTAAADGSELRVLSHSPGLSHFVWSDPATVMIWRNGCYRAYPDDGTGLEHDLFFAPNGHQTVLPDGQWMVTDTYPRGPRREQVLYLVHLPTEQLQPLGRFASPTDYRGEWRCDLHPRVNRRGDAVVIDSPHGGAGRQLYLVELPDRTPSDNPGDG